MPLFFDPNQEILVPFHHDVVPAELYVKSFLYKDNKKFLSICKYSAELFYKNNDYQSLDVWFFSPEIKKLTVENLPAIIEIKFKTYPFFNNYLIAVYKYKHLPQIGKKILEFIKNLESINIILTGDLGSGKTTFVKSIINTTSPSFNIFFSWNIENKIVNHWDLYRIHVDQENLNNIDFWFHLNQENTVNFIEWGNKIKLEYYLSNSPVQNLVCFNFSFLDNREDQRILTICSFEKSILEDLFSIFE